MNIKINSGVPTASFENFEKILKGLRRVVPPAALAKRIAAFDGIEADERRPRIPLADIKRLVDDLSDETGDPLLMVRAFSHLDYGRPVLRRTFLAGADTLFQAVFLMQRYMSVCTDLSQLELEVVNGRACLCLRPNPAFAASPQQLDSMLYAQLRILAALETGPISDVAFPQSPSPSLQSRYRDIFAVPVRFGARGYGIRFPASELCRALKWDQCNVKRVARRERKLIRRTSQHRWSESVQTLMSILLRTGEPRIDSCADLLAVSRRTLQRRIESEGITFRGLLDDVRRTQALEYLAQGHSCEIVATLIGYRQVSQFYRAFRGWYGVSPRDYRRRLEIDAARMPASRGLWHTRVA